MYYYLVKEGHFSIMDLNNTDWFFANLLYEKFADEVEKRNKQQEEENRRQEQEMANYQNMQNFQSKMMDSISHYNPGKFDD